VDLKRRDFNKMLAAAVGGVVVGAVAKPALAGDDKGKDAAKGHSCKGKNECKGKGGCKTSDAGCTGKNSCKGKGGCASDHGKTGGDKK
jgi:hypothetical protein